MNVPSFPRSMTRPFVFFCCTLLWAGAGIGETYFTDATQESGEALTQTVNLPTWGDYNNDGWPDLFLGEILSHNEGNGRFVEQPVPEALVGARGKFGDYDNDGDLDLYAIISSVYSNREMDILGRNDGGVFVDVTLEAGLIDTLPSLNSVWLDYDRDGFIDWFEVCRATPSGDEESAASFHLYRNNGDGTFAEVTTAAGLGEMNPIVGRYVLGVAAADFTNDGWPDLYVGVQEGPNWLFHNDGRGGFRDATTREVADAGPATGCAVGDIDNDGDLDLFQATRSLLGETLGWRSVMLLNLGDGMFLDVTEGVGLAELSQESRFGPGLVDVDNDGDLDLLTSRPPALYLNDGNGMFADHTDESGMTETSLIAAWGDCDLDGFLDVYMAAGRAVGNRLYRNNGNDNHFLQIELAGVESNRTGIGARLIVTSGESRQVREILGGLGEQQDEMVAHFGLGERTQVDELEIRWPSGQVDLLTDISADQKIRVFEGREGYHVVRPTRWEHDLPDEVTRKTTLAMKAVVQPALFDPDATITRVTADLSELGGPADLSLEADEDGVYRLDSSLEIDVLRGVYTAYVNIDQQTFLGDHWVRLAKVLTVLDEGAPLFVGAGEEDWTWHGQDLVRLTDQPTEDAWPSWSPDGTQIAFQSNRDEDLEGDLDIYVMDADGSNPVNLTSDPAIDWCPSWSPDGTQIAFQSNRDEDDEIHVMDADGSNPVNLTWTDGHDNCPSWSPDGTRIVFHSNRDGNFEIYVMDADGGNQTNLTNNDAMDGNPSWFPDGSRIAFYSNRDGNSEIYVMDADGGNPISLTHRPEHEDWAPSWTPDGTKIVFMSYQDGNFEIYVMGADGGDPIQMTHHPDFDQAPAWSPDGSRIAFASNRTGNGDLFILTPGDASRVEIDPQERGTVFTGSEALAVRAGSGWWLSCQPEAPFDWTGYAALRFAFHPGDLAASAGEELRVWIGGKEVDLLADGSVDLAEKKWQVVEIPFEQFELKEPIACIDFSGDFTGSFYIDDLRLVPKKPSSPGSTAVVEERAAGLPERFTLDQNYPNPFNSDTIICYALPTAADVELAIFNLAGQRVATLVEGMRQAGTYMIRWDGRDDDGRALASGVYLYRLQTGNGQEVETRKLLLLR
jgi:Tol biopolymer transport system component